MLEREWSRNTPKRPWMHAHLKDGVHVVRGDILLEDGDQEVRDSLHGSLKQLVALFRVLHRVRVFLQLMIFTHSISSL